MMKRLLCSGLVLPAAAMLLVAVSPAGAEETVLVPFGSTVRYATFAGGQGDVPEEVNGVGYDDSGWALGTAPFGWSDEVYCPLDAVTPWPLGTTIVARVWVDLPPGSRDLRFQRRMISYSGISINGYGFGSCSGGGSPCPWWLCDQTAPYEYSGPTLIVVTQETYSWNATWNYMDFQISADVPPTATDRGTWGTLKVLYR